MFLALVPHILKYNTGVLSQLRFREERIMLHLMEPLRKQGFSWLAKKVLLREDIFAGGRLSVLPLDAYY